jgi:CheY-like chemotaxis protein
MSTTTPTTTTGGQQMRPPKRILLVDCDQDRQSVTRFVLGQHGYVIVSARNLAEAEREAPNMGHIDLALGYDIRDDRRLAEIAAGWFSNSVVVLDLEQPSEGFAEILRKPKMEQLIEAIKQGTARRRGPRKGVKRQPAHEALEVVAA